MAASIPAELRVFDRLFTDPHPEAGDRDFRTLLNPASKQVLRAFAELPLNHRRD